MKVLETIYAALSLILFVLTWRFKTNEEDATYRKLLEIEADEAIRSGDSARIIAMWGKLRQ